MLVGLVILSIAQFRDRCTRSPSVHMPGDGLPLAVLLARGPGTQFVDLPRGHTGSSDHVLPGMDFRPVLAFK